MAVEFSPEEANENSPVCFGAAFGYEGKRPLPIDTV